MASKAKYLVVIAGPTGVGKTALAIALAKHYGSVILSSDSRQFYKEMDIGTAKPSASQRQEVKHYFIDHKNITELYGAGHFEKEAIGLADDLFKKHDVLFMVGGSGLYIDAVLNGVDDFVEVPPTTRESLNLQFEKNGLAWLQDEIKRLDPAYFNTADLQNPQRLIRALEVSKHTGLPYSSFLNRGKTSRNFIPIKILVNTDREKLYEQIDRRVDGMMKSGLLEEARRLEAYRNFNALKTVGYKELYEHLDGKLTLEAAIDKIKQHTRNYAKRQLTWFKNKDSFKTFKPGDADGIKAYIDHTISHG